MSQFRTASWWQRLRRAALGVDATVDDGLYRLGQRLAAAWQRYAAMMDGLHTRGPTKWAIDAASEGVTLAVAGLIVLLVLAVPAFRETARDDWLKQQDLAVTFLDRQGNEIGRRGIRHNDSIAVEELPDHVVKAVLATEDRRFWEHWGIDPFGLVRALMVNTRGGAALQGGSTITQQLAKNLFLSNERSLDRKINEAFLALWLEARLSKREILKLYLDRAYMGGGAFGIQAAAEFYFGKDIREVTVAEAAMLAGLFKAPSRFAPHVNLPAARARANTVLAAMVEAGYLTEGQIFAARRNPATAVERARTATADYYLDTAFEEARRLAAAGAFGDERVLVIRTALDSALQRHAEQALENHLRQFADTYNADQGAIVVMEINGALRAIVGGRDYGQSQFNRAVDGLRQTGSAFKAFVYAAAFEAGIIQPDSIVVDRSVCVGNWCPRNYSGGASGAAMPVTTAMARSINTIPVALTTQMGKALHPQHDFRAARVGRDKTVDMMRRMGITAPLRDTPSLPIGAVEVSTLEMAAGFGAFAADGLRVTPRAALEARNSRGDLLWSRETHEPAPPRVMATGVARAMNLILSKVPEEGTGRRAALPGLRTAGKTGTSSAYRDAWYVGYSGNFITGVWIGNDDFSPMDNMTGGTVPAMVWKEVMSFAHLGVEPLPIPGLPPMEAPRPPTARGREVAPPPVATLPPRPALLSRRSFEVLSGMADAMAAERTRGPASPGAPNPPVSARPLDAAPDGRRAGFDVLRPVGTAAAAPLVPAPR